MPWPWTMCKACMDLDKGTFVQWPMGPLWEDNEFILGFMMSVWEAYKFHQHTSKPKAKWTEWHINYDTWLNESRPENVRIMSDYDHWLKQQNG